MLESPRRIRAALIGATILGAVATTAQAASPPAQPIVEIGPVNMTSIVHDHSNLIGFRIVWPFAITAAGDYVFSVNLDRFEMSGWGFGDISFNINIYDYTIKYMVGQPIIPKSETVFMGVGNYFLSITALGANYEAIGVHASVTAVPGPIAGAGLPLLLGFAGYAAWRRRQDAKAVA